MLYFSKFFFRVDHYKMPGYENWVLNGWGV